MDSYIISDLNNSAKPKKCKELYTIGDKHLVIVDKSIVEKLGITEDSTAFLEQEVIRDEMILMRIKKFPVDIKR